jgi:LPS O-antigen subunit length determinant protein (WzzB/FepE family)
MSEVHQQNNEEIDLFELFETLWNGKWKIFLTVVVTVVAVFGFQLTQPPSSFIATTEIRPITTVEAENYDASNAIGFFKVIPSLLQNMYVEQLEERKFFKEAIHEFALIEKVNFEDDESYNEAIVKLSSSIKILPPINVDGAKKGDSRRFWTIEFEYNDEEKWRNTLSSVNRIANQSVKRIVQQRFETYLSIAKQKRSFELEDINIQISNALIDYERTTSDRLAFLREQAGIARKLGVAKNTIEAQTFSAKNGMVANINTDTPFYLRGYEAIEKEIELIALREDIRAFIGGFFVLEQNKRALEQDKILERAESLFASTPIVSQNDFLAVSARIEATEFKSQSKRILYAALSILLGGMLGAMYVLVSNSIRKRKAVLSSLQ